MFDVHRLKEGGVGVRLNPNSVLRYEHCHLAALSPPLSSNAHATEVSLGIQGRTEISIPLP